MYFAIVTNCLGHRLHKKSLHNEPELLLLIAKGDTRAYGQLFDYYWDQVYGAGLQLTKNPELAKDLAQDIFLKLWNTRSKLPGIKNFSGYLYVITRNLIHDQLRMNVFRESNKEFLVSYVAYTNNCPQEQLEQKELHEVLDETINQLSPKLRQVFKLSRLESLSHEEIAERLHITPLSSKTYMVRALMTLRKLLSKKAGKLLSIILLLFKLLIS